MALETRLQLKLKQKLVLTQSLQQAIKMLQLTQLELTSALEAEICENPMLETDTVDEAESPPVAAEGPEKLAESGEEGSPEVEAEPIENSLADIELDSFFADYIGDLPSEGRSFATSDEDGPDYENSVTTVVGLTDYLLEQLHLLDLEPTQAKLCEFVIGNLDGDGFLCATVEEIVEATGVEPSAIAEALRVIRSFDPPGVCARDLRECLLLQVATRRFGPTVTEVDEQLVELTERVLTECWDDFLHQRWDVLASECDVEVGAFAAVVELLKKLEIRPGRPWSRGDNHYVSADVEITRVDGRYLVVVNDDGLPRLRLNRQYVQMLEGKHVDREAASYLRERMRSAMWLMKSIDQRQQTIHKVASSIVEHQQRFFAMGLLGLKPMVLKDVADDIGMHESTVSRVVSNKYMDTPRGLLPFKFFFHSGVDSAKGDNVSSLVVKERINALIDEEDSRKPLSDSKIMRQLQREGVRLARRTVAKYREELAIPASDKRKKVF